MTEFEIIQSLGLTDNETKVYLAFFDRGSFTATEIANTSGISRTIIYRVLDGLMRKGLCSLIPGKIKKYRASQPDVAFSQLIHKKEQNIKEAYSLVQVLTDRFNESASEDTDLDYIEILKDPFLINSRYINLLARSEKEILGFVREPTVSIKTNTIDQQANEAIKLNREKGVIHKSIFDLKLFNKPIRSKESIKSSYEFAQKVRNEGNRQIKIYKNLPIKATIFDERYVMLVLPDPIREQFAVTTLIFDHKNYAKSMKLLFESLWEKAMDWENFEQTYLAK